MQKLIKNYIGELQSMALFHGIEVKDLDSLLACSGAYIREYRKEEFVILPEEWVKYIGVILAGKVQMMKEDLFGNKAVLVNLVKGEIFGESFTCSEQNSATVSVVASSDAVILFLPFEKVMRSCSTSCAFHHRMIENMVELIANKNKSLMEKIDIISKKTLREKISAYLSREAQKQKSVYFEIPLGRVQLAEYLCADRSALTRELNSMKEDGMIDFDKNLFRIILY